MAPPPLSEFAYLEDGRWDKMVRRPSRARTCEALTVVPRHTRVDFRINPGLKCVLWNLYFLKCRFYSEGEFVVLCYCGRCLLVHEVGIERPDTGF